MECLMGFDASVECLRDQIITRNIHFIWKLFRRQIDRFLKQIVYIWEYIFNLANTISDCICGSDFNYISFPQFLYEYVQHSLPSK